MSEDTKNGAIEASDIASGKPESVEPKQRLKKNGKPRMARGKFWGIVGVIVVVFAVAGAGMYKWHEQPSFCSTMCHIEADYVANYSQEQGVAGTDKYGQPVSNTNAMMAVLHRQNKTTAKSEILCVDCHVPNYVELAHDGVNFVSGNYYMPRDERSLSKMMSWDGKEGSQFCVNENCHSYLLGQDGKLDYGKLESATQQMDFNPHAQHHENMQMECTTCHKGHRASIFACTGCHEGITLPDGWLTYTEGEKTFASGIKG